MHRKGHLAPMRRIPPMGRPSLDLGANSLVAGGSGEDAWECADCGWRIETTGLLPGWTLSDARDRHDERYCGRPPTWPTST